MKKIITFAAMLLAALSMGAQEKSLVVFFSHTGENYAVGNIKVGNTKRVADFITELTGADQFEVVAQKSYAYDYKTVCDIAKAEQEKGELPAFKGAVENIDRYDVIYIGTPIWWGTYPQVMFTFFSKYDLNCKTLVPFSTHEGSGLGRTVSDLKKAYPKADVKTGLAIQGSKAKDSKKSVENWLRELGQIK